MFCYDVEPYATPNDFTDKKSSVRYYMTEMVNRTQSLFRYSGLPKTIPQRNLELYLQINGNCCITEVKGELYAFTGGLGGKPNEYYMPTIYTIANPGLDVSKNLKINDECIVIPNDSCYAGLMPMYNRYASLLAENDISIRMAAINARCNRHISASDDATFKSATAYLSDIEKGKFGAIAETAFLDGVKVQPSPEGSNAISQLIELQQYIKASWFNDLGLNANYNMKRESINTSEAQLNDDALLPLIDDMLKMRKIGLEKVNEKYGTNISVELASAWEDNKIELDAEQELLKGGEENAESENSIPDMEERNSDLSGTER